jgi:helix-turn-helix protein
MAEIAVPLPEDRAAELAAIILDEPWPCEDCKLARACAARLLSCRAFGEYVAGASEAAWRAAQRWPTREAWEAMFEVTAKRRRPVAAKAAVVHQVFTPDGALLTTKAAAAQLGVTRETLGRWCNEGAPRSKACGGAGRGVRALFDLAALRAWLAENRPDFASRPKRDPTAPSMTPKQRRERQRLSMQRIRDRRRAAATAA